MTTEMDLMGHLMRRAGSVMSIHDFNKDYSIGTYRLVRGELTALASSDKISEQLIDSPGKFTPMISLNDLTQRLFDSKSRQGRKIRVYNTRPMDCGNGNATWISKSCHAKAFSGRRANSPRRSQPTTHVRNSRLLED